MRANLKNTSDALSNILMPLMQKSCVTKFGIYGLKTQLPEEF